MHACAYVIASMCGHAKLWVQCLQSTKKGESDVMEKEVQAPVNHLVWIVGVLFKSVRAIYTPPSQIQQNKTTKPTNILLCV